MGNICSNQSRITLFDKCAICQSSLVIKELCPFRCKHAFHLKCCNKFYKSRIVFRCPICRSLPKLQYKNITIVKNSTNCITPSKYSHIWKDECIKNHSIKISRYDINLVSVECSCGLKRMCYWKG